MRHLSTEELLLQCDGELGLERSSHVERCAACQAALIDLQARLYEVECYFRASVPPEPAESRIASWVSLEEKLYPRAKVRGFPLRWPAVYATAAALTIAVLGGYLSSLPTAPDGPAETARLEIVVPEPAPRVTEAPQPLAESPVLASTIAPPKPGLPARPPEETESPVGQLVLFEDAPPAGDRAADNLARPVRFDVPSPTRPLQARGTLDSFAPPDVISESFIRQSSQPSHVVVNLDVPLAPEPVRELSQSRPTTEAVAAMIDGYWILTQADAWREDIAPVWTGNGLRFEGSVEDEAAKQRLVTEIERKAGSRRVTAELRVRQGYPTLRPAVFDNAALVAVVDRRPAGGAVRHTLLAHFSDAARRSFLSPQPSVLEAELDRFVSDVFRSQSQLLSHVYALKTLVGVVDGERAAALDPVAASKFRELMRLHMSAAGEQTARIYDRLSETLPRKFWSYRPSERDAAAGQDWQGEGAGLLRDTLQLDSNLTVLLSNPQSTIDASTPDLSCGELLHRIRSRIGRLKAGAEAPR